MDIMRQAVVKGYRYSGRRSATKTRKESEMANGHSFAEDMSLCPG
jgi:hypothetical protein